MDCPKCGNSNPDDAAYCAICQEIFRKKPMPRPVQPAPAPQRPSWWPTAGMLLALFVVLSLARPFLHRAFWLLDFVDLAFHEGGHIIFGIPGNRFIMVIGGTLMQLLVPAAATVHFLARGQKISACATSIWLGQNFLNIGAYVADARAQQLNLVAGGVHDWTYLLEDTRLIIHDEGLGLSAELLGCLIMAVAVAVGIRLWRARKAG